jgi:hypothetical protein
MISIRLFELLRLPGRRFYPGLRMSGLTFIVVHFCIVSPSAPYICGGNSCNRVLNTTRRLHRRTTVRVGITGSSAHPCLCRAAHLYRSSLYAACTAVPAWWWAIHASRSPASELFAHFAFFASFLSFLPPLSISRCPAFSARNFSVVPTRPAALFFLIWLCWIRAVFLGLITRAPGLGPVREGLWIC